MAPSRIAVDSPPAALRAARGSVGTCRQALDAINAYRRAILIASLLLAFSGGGPLGLSGQEPTLDFRRAYVPRAEVENVGAGFVPLSRDKFEATVARLREEGSAVAPARVRLTSAVWFGVFDGEKVRGVARWTPAKTSSQSADATAVLGSTTLFLDPLFAAEDAPAIPDSAIAAIEKQGDAAALAADDSRPRLFLRSDGLLGAEFPQGLPATTAWSARTEAPEEGARVAQWRLPEALRTTLWLVVPEGVQLSSEGDWLVEQIAIERREGETEGAGPAFNLFRLLGQPLAGEPLELRFASVSEPPAEEFLYRVANRYVRSSRGLDVEYEVTLDSRVGELEVVRTLLPASVTPVEALQGEARLELARTEAPSSPDASGAVEWLVRFPTAVATSTTSLRLRGIVSLEPTGETPLPQLRISGATWAGETSTIVAESPLEIQGVFGEGIVPVAGPAGVASNEERYRHRTEQSAIAARFGRPPGRATVESVLSLRAGRSSLEASLFAEISATEGAIFEKQLRLLGPWSLDRIEVEPAGALLDWSIDDRRTIRLRFREGILPGQTLRLACEAHLRIDDPEFVRSGEMLRVFEFVENVQERRAIALFDDATFRFRPARIDDWRTLTRADLTAAQRANLGSSLPRVLLPDDAAFRAMEFAFESEESRLEVSSTTSLERSGASIAGRIEVECLSLSAPIDRLLIAFSSPLPPGSRWSSAEAEDVPFEAERVHGPETSSDGGETWELIFARPVATPFDVLAAYELPEEISLAAPLASAPAAATQTGRLSIEAELLEEREATGLGLERVPSAGEPGEAATVRFRYDPARRHSASLEPAPGAGAPGARLTGPVVLRTDVSSAGLHHTAIYRVFGSYSAPTRLKVAAPPGAVLGEVRATGDEEEVAPAAGSESVIELETPSGLRTIEVRYFQRLPSLSLWSKQNVALPQIESLQPDAIEWSVDSRGAVAFDVEAEGWRNAEEDEAKETEASVAEEASGEVEAVPAVGGSAFISLAADRPLSLNVYRTDVILQAAWIAFFAVAAFIWALSSRAPAASAVVIAALATALAFLPEPAEALRWGALYGAAAGLVCSASFYRARFASPLNEPLDRKHGLAKASSLALLALISTGAYSTFAQEVAAPASQPRTYRVLIPTDDAGQPTGSYYYASREFYDRFLAVERALERPDEEWRIVDAAYEGTMSPGVIDGAPRLSQLTLHLEIETYADDVIATLPLNRRYAEFAGMMEGDGMGGVEAALNQAGDSLSLRFEEAGRRELAVRFYPTTAPDLPAGARAAMILPIPWAKLFVTGPAEALDDLSVTGALGAGERRPTRENLEIDLGPADEVAFSSRRAASVGIAGPAVRWTAGLRILGDSEDCRIDARVFGEAPLGVLVSRSTVEAGPGWRIDTASAPGMSFRIEAAASRTPGRRRYDIVFDEARTGEIAFDLVLLPESGREAGLFRTPRLSIDGAPPTATLAWLQVAAGTEAEWTPAAPGRVATSREVPAALQIPVGADQVRLLPAGDSANFVVRDPETRPFYAVQSEFYVSSADMKVRYEIAMPVGAERWQEFDLPEAIEVSDVYLSQASGRSGLVRRRVARRLFVKAPAVGMTPDVPAPIVIEGTIRGLSDGSATLSGPALRRASLSQIDLRVYRRAGLDVSIDAGSGFQVNPTFVPGAFIEGKGRVVGAFLSNKSSGSAIGKPPAPPLLRSRPAAPASATLWTSTASQELRQIARFEIEVDRNSGRLDRVAMEAPATLGAPELVSPAGTLTVRESANPDRRYWIFVPTQPLAPGASVILSAPLDPASAGRTALRPVRLLNVDVSERFVLLPERMEDRKVAWSVMRLQPAREDDRIRRRVAALGGDLSPFEATDETFSARARRVDSQATTPFAVRWTDRRVRFDAPGEYRAISAWDVSPQEQSAIEIRMPDGTTPTALEIDGVPCRWTQRDRVVRANLLPAALPFRLTLSYRGAIASEDEAARSEPATSSLSSPVLGEGVSQGEAWLVEATPAAPWSPAGGGSPTRLDYVDARLAAFQIAFAATAPRTEGCTPEETRAFALARLLDLTEMRRLALAEPNSPKRDDTLAQLDTVMQPYRDVLVDLADAQASSMSDLDPLLLARRSDDLSLEPASAKLLAVRLGGAGSLSTIDLPVSSRAAPRQVPWRRIAETTAIVLLCLVVARFGRSLLRWFEQMPLPIGTLAFVALAPLFLPAGWLAPAMALAFLAFSAVAARRWLLPLLPQSRRRGAPAP
ncbi:MAG TPA: hypothetical protein VGN57_02650 [Pirellulaceae bacterium]|jgi:hypothetical protein|nr:hypothetical protein [Pirellulaceae bacterium]